MTWLEIVKGGKAQINIRLDPDQALILAEAIIGSGDGISLLTRDQAIKQVAAMIQAWAITPEELEGENTTASMNAAGDTRAAGGRSANSC
jgi:hypothetical protein